MNRFAPRIAVLVLALAMAHRPGAAQQTDAAPDDRKHLEAAQDIVGSWRGVGQPKRGSTAGAWIERADWSWEFGSDGAALVCESPEGKHFREGRLIVDPDRDSGYRLTLESSTSDGQEASPVVSRMVLTGGPPRDGTWTFTADEPREGSPARVTWKFVAEGMRLVMLLEGRSPGTERYYRIAEIGYTRQGIRFAQASGGPECIVTGGRGETTVEHDGKTYYVCCTGCRDLFLADPEKVLEEHRRRKEDEKREQPRESP